MTSQTLHELKCAIYVASKDLLAELRRKYEVFSMLTFALISIIIFNFAFGIFSAAVHQAVPAIIWIIILFAGMFGFSTVFTRESDQGTLDGLRMLPISSQSIFLGKVVYGFLLMGVIEVIFVPLSMVLYSYTFTSSFLLTGLVFVLGTLDLAVVGALVSGLTMYTESRALLIPLLMFPLVLPVVIPLVILTQKLILGVEFYSVLPELRMVALTLAALAAAALLLFDYVLQD
ncbi:heme exporter protein CcmB [Candidatus Hecatella orcuttiae]|uniref:heme exporter protein CcmB n=1 Tax=Candidatus Hecatella orcuttiae TaxID=1935119 RepID=UPI0028680D74|nr:heme exporter protein CcmB [Candidatus Hecatella orcuttiae]